MSVRLTIALCALVTSCSFSSANPLPPVRNEPSVNLSCTEFQSRFRANLREVATYENLFSDNRAPLDEAFPRWKLRGWIECPTANQIERVFVCVDFDSNELGGEGPRVYFGEVVNAFVNALKPGGDQGLIDLWQQVLDAIRNEPEQYHAYRELGGAPKEFSVSMTHVDYSDYSYCAAVDSPSAE